MDYNGTREDTSSQPHSSRSKRACLPVRSNRNTQGSDKLEDALKEGSGEVTQRETDEDDEGAPLSTA